MLTLKKVKELVEAPVHTKRVPSPKMLLEEGLILLRKEFEHGSHLTVYNSGYVLFSAGKRNTVFHIHDCQGDYAYDAAEGKGDVIQEEYFENCEWHIRALFEGERKMEESQVKCEVAGQTNVSVSYHAVSEEWGEIADRTINMLEKIIENAPNGFENVRAVLTEYVHRAEKKPQDMTEQTEYEKCLTNGTYERARESGTEQNYNMIDGCVNNVPKKPRRIGGRWSVLDRLHIKQAERKQKDQPQQQQERSRKN